MDIKKEVSRKLEKKRKREVKINTTTVLQNLRNSGYVISLDIPSVAEKTFLLYVRA